MEHCSMNYSTWQSILCVIWRSLLKVRYLIIQRFTTDRAEELQAGGLQKYCIHYKTKQVWEDVRQCPFILLVKLGRKLG
jgi:hypothetical protein